MEPLSVYGKRKWGVDLSGVKTPWEIGEETGRKRPMPPVGKSHGGFVQESPAADCRGRGLPNRMPEFISSSRLPLQKPRPGALPVSGEGKAAGLRSY